MATQGLYIVLREWLSPLIVSFFSKKQNSTIFFRAGIGRLVRSHLQLVYRGPTFRMASERAETVVDANERIAAVHVAMLYLTSGRYGLPTLSGFPCFFFNHTEDDQLLRVADTVALKVSIDSLRFLK